MAELRPDTVLSSPALLSELTATLRDRRRVLGLSQLAVDDIAGLPSGYQGKLEAKLTNPAARNARSIGWESLPLLLGALKVRLAVVAEEQMPASSEHSVDDKSAALSAFFVRRAQAGARARNAALSPEERSARARIAAAARWTKKMGANPDDRCNQAPPQQRR
jgi:hypothetical protein